MDKKVKNIVLGIIGFAILEQVTTVIGAVGESMYKAITAKGDLSLARAQVEVNQMCEEEEEFTTKIPMGFRFDKSNSKGKED